MASLRRFALIRHHRGTDERWHSRTEWIIRRVGAEGEFAFG
jgi:hypothetical protein